jgi:hypothetical protein
MTLKKRDSIITEAEIAFAELLMKGEDCDESCAEQAGFKRGMGRQVKRRPCVQKYMQERRDRLLAEIERGEIDSLKKFEIGREAIIARLWAIGNMGPEKTNGSVLGQVQALNSLNELLGLGQAETAGLGERAGG